MSELLVNTIKKADGTGSLAIPAESGTVVTTASPSLGRRNLIINGAMQVAQRGTSTSSVTGGGYYACDRWAWYVNTSDTVTISQSTDSPDGYSNSFKVEVTASASLSAGSLARIEQRIEAQNLQHLKYNTSAAETLTLSFWVKSAQTGVHIVGMSQDDASTNAEISTTYTISSADTWEYKTVSFVGNTGESIANDNGLGLRLNFVLAAGTNFTSGSNDVWGTNTNWAPNIANNFLDTVGNTFQITGVQLEVGSVATPFEHRSYGEELALCQRYYYLLKGSGTSITGLTAFYFSNTWMQTAVIFPTEMRATPTLDYDSGTSYWNFYRIGNVDGFNTLDFNGVNNRQAHLYNNTDVSGTSGDAGWIESNGTTRKIAFDAEL